MRKLLLATTALVGGIAISGAAQAAAPSAPITLNVGGYVDFVAGFFDGSSGDADAAHGITDSKPAGRDFETEFKINFDALGKASNGIEYGANVSLWNGADVTNTNGWTNNALSGGTQGAPTPFSGGDNQVTINSAFVWLSGGFGKLLMGDVHGATDLFVYAPTVGEGQVDGRYMDFADPTVLARFQPSGIDNTEHSTNITYYTPKVGNDNNKVQLGVTYEPNMYDYGQSVIKYDSNFADTNVSAYSPYQDVIKGAAQYTGNFHPVNVVASGQIIQGFSSSVPMADTALGQFAIPTAGNAKAQDFTAWGVGAQVGFAGFTVGGSYVDMGRYMTVAGQNHDQNVFTVGGKYEWNKWGVAGSWLTGKGYDNLLAGSANVASGGGSVADYHDELNDGYVSGFNAEGLGATYTWFPGLTTNIDGVMFQQKNVGLESAAGALDTNTNAKDDGYVILVSEKMTF